MEITQIINQTFDPNLVDYQFFREICNKLSKFSQVVLCFKAIKLCQHLDINGFYEKDVNLIENWLKNPSSLPELAFNSSSSSSSSSPCGSSSNTPIDVFSYLVRRCIDVLYEI